VETAMRTSGPPKADTGLLSEFAEWTDRRTTPDAFDAIAERRRLQRSVSEFWKHLKTAITAAIASANNRVPEALRVETGDTPTGGLALTRWTTYPIAFLDVSVDDQQGRLKCAYNFAARPGEQYGALTKSWSIRAENERLIVSDERGAHAPEDVVQEIVDVYLSKL